MELKRTIITIVKYFLFLYNTHTHTHTLTSTYSLQSWRVPALPPNSGTRANWCHVFAALGSPTSQNLQPGVLRKFPRIH